MICHSSAPALGVGDGEWGINIRIALFILLRSHHLLSRLPTKAMYCLFTVRKQSNGSMSAFAKLCGRGEIHTCVMLEVAVCVVCVKYFQLQKLNLMMAVQYGYNNRLRFGLL